MKRTLLFIACVLTSIMMSAQESSYFDYVPFVKDGKQWHVVRSEFDRGNHFKRYMFTNEEVTKGGKTYMKMYRTEDDLAVVYDAGLLREENRKVYFFDNDTQKEYLMFDYSLKEGDSYETYSYDEQKAVTYKVLSVDDYTEGPEVIHYTQETDSMRAEYRYLRKWTVCRADDNFLQKTWIEGVGSLEGPLGNLYYTRPISSRDYLAYVEFPDDYRFDNPYLPFSFYDTMNKQIHGSDLPKTASYISGDWQSQLTYELEGDRLHVYGQLVLNCGCYNYAYFTEEPTDDPLVHKLHLEIQNVGIEATCVSLFATDFYVPGFDPTLNYIVVDDQGEEHPVINKTPQMAYRPMIEDGKVWKTGDTSVNPVQSVAFYYFDGDTIINGKVCKQMMCQLYYGPDYHNDAITFPIPALRYIGAWYEEDKKVYYYDINNQLKMMYDFSIEANDTLLVDNEYQFVVGPKQTGGLKGFKGVYRDIMWYWSGSGSSNYSTTWLEGVGSIDGPTSNVFYSSVKRPPLLMSCTVGDEVIYLNDEYQDGATPETSNAPKQRLDFTHIIKSKPKVPMMRTAEQPLYGEYNDQQLGINLDPIDDAYLVRITNESGKLIYEKAINAGNIVALNIDISAYPKGRYTVTIENSQESFTGEFDALATGVVEVRSKRLDVGNAIYNLQGQRISSLQKGLNIVNGKKVYVK